MAPTVESFRALVARPPLDGKANLVLEQVRLRAVGPDEVLVKIVATGICHSDMHYATESASTGTYPRVLGHEGTACRCRRSLGMTSVTSDA